MRRRVASGVILAAAAAFAFSFPGGSAQDRPQDRPLRHDAAAVVKLVAVRVLGPDGRSITDLKKEDFTIFEDGQRKPITEFEIHVVTEAGMTMTPPRPPAAEEAVRESVGMNRKFFFFFDLQAADMAGKVKAQNAALHFLDTQAKPGDEAAVLGFYSMSGFFIREYLTVDMDLVRRAIKGAVEAPPSYGEVIAVAPDETDRPGQGEGRSGGSGEESSVAERTAVVAGSDRPEFLLPQPVFVPGTAMFQRRDFVDRMADLAEVFKTISGTKNLVLFTSRNLGAAWERLGKMFGAAGTAVFAVNTQDWKMSFFGTKVHHIWWDHSLKSLAAASGGIYLADINDYAGNARDVQDVTGHFYILGYYVKESWEGKYHKIRVEVARPGVQVLVQDGYADPKPFAEMTDFEKDVQLFDLIWSDTPVSHPLAIPVEALVVADGRTAKACLLAEFAVGAKTDVPASKVEVFALLRTAAGTPLVSRKWDIDLARYDGRILCPYLISPLPAGAYDFRLAVRDRKTGESFVGRTRFDVAVLLEEGIRLHTPLLVEKGVEASFLSLVQPPDKKRGAREPLLIDLFRLIPRDSRPALREILTGSARLTAVLPFEIKPAPSEDEPPLLGVEAKLISRADGVERPVAIAVRDHKMYGGNPEILVAEIMLPSVVPGVYDLEITVEDIGAGRRASVRKTLVVR